MIISLSVNLQGFLFCNLFLYGALLQNFQRYLRSTICSIPLQITDII